MTQILFFTALLVLLSTGTGLWLDQKLHWDSGLYHAPAGFVVYLAVLQLAYYPLQLFGLSSSWLMAVSALITGAALLYSLFHFRTVLREYLRPETLWILLAFGMFLFVFYHCSVGLDRSDSSLYLNFITQNIRIAHLGRFSFSNGLLGDSPDVFYLFQGYYYLGSFLCWLVNIPSTLLHIGGYVEHISACVWILGSLYSLVSSMFVINVCSARKNLGRFRNYLLLFLLLFYNFYYWRVAYAFYGNTWRTLLVGMLMYLLYEQYQENRAVPAVLIQAVIAAGLACSSSFLFISADILYLAAAFLCTGKQSGILKTLTVYALPVVLYTIAFLTQGHLPLAAAAAVLAGIWYFLLYAGRIRGFLAAADAFLWKWGGRVLLLGIPCFFAAYSVYVWIANPGYGINFANYFSNYADYDMTLDPFGIYSNPLEKVLILCKWVGYALLVRKGWKNSWIAFSLLFALVIFLNPLTITAISKLYTYNVYYRAFDIILNPFTIVLFAEALVQAASRSFFLPVLKCLVCAAVLMMHLNLFTGITEFTSYAFQLKDGRTVNPIYKVSDEEYALIDYLRNADMIPADRQITVLSHAEGFKTFFPTVYQIYTKAQIYDPTKRLDETFYQMAKRQFSWEKKPDVDYSRACAFMEKYHVDVAVINYYESFEFDQNTDACMTTVYSSDHYHVKTLNQNQ